MVVEADSTEGEVGIEVVLEIIPTRALLRSGGQIPVRVRNITSHPISLKPRMVIGKVSASPLPMMGDDLVKKGEGREITIPCPNLPSG